MHADKRQNENFHNTQKYKSFLYIICTATIPNHPEVFL